MKTIDIEDIDIVDELESDDIVEWSIVTVLLPQDSFLEKLAKSLQSEPRCYVGR